MPGREIVSLQDIQKHFPIRGGVFKKEVMRINALNGVDLAIREGEVLGLVGESGCGKSTLARLLVKLYEPSMGKIFFKGRPLEDLKARAKKQFYQQVQMIFQDPSSSLNPRLRVKDIIGEMLRIRGVRKHEERRQVRQILIDMGLTADVLNKYPHEFSGGQRQRIAIARALIVRPKLLIADEPVSSLDVFTQAQIITLLKDLKNKYNLTILFVSHDLNTVNTLCDRAAVMYLGRIMEILPARQLFQRALHPYLRALIDSIPVTDPALRRRRNKVIAGEVPDPTRQVPGCPFHPRCPIKAACCETDCPSLSERNGNDHVVACHRV